MPVIFKLVITSRCLKQIKIIAIDTAILNGKVVKIAALGYNNAITYKLPKKLDKTKFLFFDGILTV
jgi:hypothetical protein